MVLAAQAQAKIAAVDEEVRRLKEMQMDLRQKKDALDAEQRNWMSERDKQRLGLAAERETAMIDIEASRKSLKKERKRFATELEALQSVSVGSEKIEEENRKLRVALVQLQVSNYMRICIFAVAMMASDSVVHYFVCYYFM